MEEVKEMEIGDEKVALRYYDYALVFTNKVTPADLEAIHSIYDSLEYESHTFENDEKNTVMCLHYTGWQGLAVEAQTNKTKIEQYEELQMTEEKKKEMEETLGEDPQMTEEKKKEMKQIIDEKKKEMKKTLGSKVYKYQFETTTFRTKKMRNIITALEHKYQREFTDTEAMNKIITPSERQRFLHHMLQTTKVGKVKDKWSKLENVKDTDNLIAFMKKEGFLDRMAPLHTSHERLTLWKRLVTHWNPPIHQLRDYLGEEAAMYFEWMKFYTNWLVVPGILSLILFYFHPLHPETSSLCGLFAAMMIFWAILFNIYWRRRTNELQITWGTHKGVEALIHPRHEFKGTPKINPITQEEEDYYSPYKRMFRYVISLVVSLLWLAPTVLMMICFLNLNGLIHKTGAKDGNEINLGYLRIECLAEMSMEGGYFDAKTLKAYIPCLLQPIVTMIFNKIYQRIAHWCTDGENHRTDEEYDNSVILKRFIFEFCNCFIPLFFIAFVICDIREFQKLMISYYMFDEIRRIFTETIQPFLTSPLSFAFIKNLLTNKAHISDLKHIQDTDIIKSELVAWEFEPFDDYLEMVLQFGYMTLFAGAYPILTFLSLVFNILEVRSDSFKLLLIYQRKPGKLVKGIGIWEPIMAILAFLSIFTNLMLFGYVSKQMDHLLSDVLSWENIIGCDHQILLFGIEHIFIIFLIFSALFIPKKPRWVSIFDKREKYQKLVRFNKKKTKLADKLDSLEKGKGLLTGSAKKTPVKLRTAQETTTATPEKFRTAQETTTAMTSFNKIFNEPKKQI